MDGIFCLRMEEYIMLKFVLFIIVGVVIINSFNKKKSKISSFDDGINCEYKCEHGNFKIKGKKCDFVIKKNGQFEFLVRDGQIIACKDKRKTSEFVYYGGVK
jgi:hypothetical protein